MPGLSALAEITHGKVFSNRMEMVFKGVPRRTFSFQFTMMPKSEAEAKSIKKFVRCLDFIWHQVLRVNEYIKNFYCSCYI